MSRPNREQVAAVSAAALWLALHGLVAVRFFLDRLAILVFAFLGRAADKALFPIDEALAVHAKSTVVLTR